MNKEEFAGIFIKKFPEYRTVLEEHIKVYGEILGHVFFGDIINSQLFNLLKHSSNEDRINDLFRFINDFYIQGDETCKNIVVVTILEYLGDDREVLNKAYTYIEEDLIKESVINEQNLGRDEWLLNDSSVNVLKKYFTLYAKKN